MTILINGQDYSACLAATPPLTLERTLNKPQQCSWALVLGGSTLPAPQRDQSVTVTAQDGTVLFTGFLVSDPLPELLGQATTGPQYSLHCAAWSMDYALDRQPLPWLTTATGLANQPAGTLLASLTQRTGQQGISTAELTTTASATPTLGCFHPRPGMPWSHHAGELASQARCAYRVHNAVVSLTPVGSVSHTLDGSTVDPASVRFHSSRVLANDVTLSGAEEPDLYVLDLFQGDGATTVFDLSRTAMTVKGQRVLDDAFTQPALNLQTWQPADPGSHLSLGPGGLVCTGGTGSDGQTTLCAVDPLELGGTLVLEAGSVSLGSGSAGILLGLYSGLVNLADCFVGFRVRSTNGALVLVPVLNGQEVGTLFTPTAGHNYLLRIRLHFPELIRSLATYYSVGSSGVLARGGGLVSSACSVVFELQDSSAALDAPATVLYDSAATPVAGTPATATFAAINSSSLQATVGYFSLTRPGTAWVTSVPPGAAERTRRIGTAAQGAECKVSSGKLTFTTAATPAAGELIKLRYRTQQRAVARLASPASQLQESANQPTPAALPGVAQWAGRVEKPVARCSADCESAALAVLDFATNTDAAWEARLAGANLHQLPSGDVWPGDTVSLASSIAGPAPELMVRSVTVQCTNASAELLQYSLSLANEWADCLSLTLHNPPALDAVLPLLPAPAANAVAPNLPMIDVSSLTGSTLTVNLNAAPPTGGGFEVRQDDTGFGNGTQTATSPQGLVLQSQVATLTLPRNAQQQQWFFRCYQPPATGSSAPPYYSRVSAALFTNIPLT